MSASVFASLTAALTSVGRFTVKNYKQALGLISELTPEVEAGKRELEIPSDILFTRFREHEAKYLKGLKEIGKLDKLAVEYVKALKMLDAAQWVLRDGIVSSD